MLNMSETELAQRTAAFAQKLKEELGSSACVDVIAESSCVGGGALPATVLPGCAVAIHLPQQSLATLALTLRQQQPAVVGRIHDDALILNLRTVFPQQQQQLIHAVRQAVNTAKTPQE
jgi:L-seryl-tRNA(Ser) seleniumtransferase